MIVYLDDILIYSRNKEEHERHVKLVLEELRKNKLRAKLKKCEFMLRELDFLGHKITDKGIMPDEKKVKAIRDWPAPQNDKEAQSFLGLANYYRRFIQNYSKIAKPMIEFANKAREWDEECVKAFEELKQRLSSEPILVVPQIPQKGDRMFVVTTDACDISLGATLEEKTSEGKLIGVVGYASKKLQKAELNYPTREKEFMAVVFALKEWEYYLKDNHFLLQTDHNSLQYIHQQKQLNKSRIARWIDFLAEFNFTIKYIPGKTNSAADALSRVDLEAHRIELTPTDTSQELLKEIKEHYKEDKDFNEIYDILSNDKKVPKKINVYIKHYSINN